MGGLVTESVRMKTLSLLKNFAGRDVRMDFGLFLSTRIRLGDETAWEVNSVPSKRLR